MASFELGDNPPKELSLPVCHNLRPRERLDATLGQERLQRHRRANGPQGPRAVQSLPVLPLHRISNLPRYHRCARSLPQIQISWRRVWADVLEIPVGRNRP